MHKERSIVIALLTIVILSEFCIFLKEGYISDFFRVAKPEQSDNLGQDKQTSIAETELPASGTDENEILAIYELDDKVIFLAKNHTTASMFSWINPKLKTEHYLAYNTLFTSSDHGETISKGIGYQIRLDNDTEPTYSDSYHFEGNRAVIDYAPCPYVRYIEGRCNLDEDSSTVGKENDARKERDKQRQDDLVEIMKAIDAYSVDNIRYPSGLSELEYYMADEIPTDPQTGKGYLYLPSVQLMAYELCVPKDYFEEAPMAGHDFCIRGSSR